MSMINVTNLTFAYEGSYDNIFDNTSFIIDTDWKLGFTGRNGRGKTTFLNILMGNLSYKGTIKCSVNFDYFPFLVLDKTLNTINIIDEICFDYEHWELIKELSLLDVSDDVLYRSFNTLSNGEQTKVLLAAMFLKQNNFLLIDEPTNHLDVKAREIVSNYLKSKKGFILVSHDRMFLDKCVDHILSINKTSIDIQKGNFSTWLVNKEYQDNFEIAQNEKLAGEINRLSKTISQVKKWSNVAEDRKIGFDPNTTEKSMGRRAYQGAKSKKLMKQAKSMINRTEKVIDEKSELLKNIESVSNLKIHQLEYHSNKLIDASDLSVYYGGNTVFSNLNFSIEKGERVLLYGKNGTGKSSILKLILGEAIKYNGDLKVANNLVISYVSQDASDLQGNLSQFALEHKIDESLFKSILNKLDFSTVQFEKNIENYSAGQKKKVMIAKSLCEKAHIHIWDEPLNYIDVISRMQIENLILEFNPTILFVEHDIAFCENIATKKIVL